MNIDILLRRYNTIRKSWINSRTPEEEQECYYKLQIIEKELKEYKARNNTSDLGSSVMNRYISLSDKSGQNGTGN